MAVPLPCAGPFRPPAAGPRGLARARGGNQLPLSPTLPFRPEAPSRRSLRTDWQPIPWGRRLLPPFTTPPRPAAALNQLLWQINGFSTPSSRNYSQLAAKLLNSSWLVNCCRARLPPGSPHPLKRATHKLVPGSTEKSNLRIVHFRP